MFDSHCHLDESVFDSDLNLVLQEARSKGITGFLAAGVSPERWPRQQELIDTHADVFASYGLHPWKTGTLNTDAGWSSPTEWEIPFDAVAIGEIGLDRSTDEFKAFFEQQLITFRYQLALARDLDLPVIIHSVRAHGHTIDVIRKDGLPDAGGVIHAFSGPIEVAQDYLRLGLHFGFGPLVCKKAARRVKEAAQFVPTERILLETDAPFGPLHKKTERNVPSSLVNVCECVAHLRQEEPDRVGEYTERNARTLFGLHTT